MMKRLFCYIAILTITAVAKADKVGTWKLYPSYTDVQEVQDAGDDIYVLASGSLFSYHKSDQTLTEYMEEGAESATGHSIDCLSSSDITHIAWVPSAKKLVIVYSNSIIDLMDTNANVGHIVAIKNSTENFDKTIDSIFVSGKYAILQTAEADTNYVKYIKIDVSHENIVKTYKVNDSVPDLPARSVTPATGFTPPYTYAKPDGPASSNTWRLYKHDGKIFSTAGAFATGLSSARMEYKGEVSYFEDDTWKQIPIPEDYLAANCMVFDPSDKLHFWIGGESGLLEYNGYDATPKQYLPAGTTLSPRYNTDNDYSVITSMTHDNQGNLWLLNGWSDPAIQRLSHDGSWTSFPHPAEIKFVETSIDNQGIFLSPTNGKIWWVHDYWRNSYMIRYDYTEDVILKVTQFTNQDGTTIKPDYISNIMEDQSGNVWLATSSGPFYIDKSVVGNSSFTVTQPKINRNDGTGLADYLLNSVNCRVIKEDVSGRRWFGTEESGVYLISADSQNQEENFTTDNSPLLSNCIYDIFVDNETGTVYFSTEKGICSYQSDITSTYGDLSEGNVYAYPNPVSPDYTGDITIMGLKSGCSIKITSATGYVVNSGTCTGASYKWDGTDRNGDRVASGVYMVLVVDAEGNDGCVTKIAIIK